MDKKRRTVVVKIIGILLILVGILYTINYFSRGFAKLNLSSSWQSIKYALLIIAGVGVFLQRDWARILTLVLSYLFVCLYGFDFFFEKIGYIEFLPQTSYNFLVYRLLPLFVFIVFITYLTRTKVKERFNAGGDDTEKRSVMVMIISILLLIYSIWLMGLLNHSIGTLEYGLFRSMGKWAFIYPYVDPNWEEASISLGGIIGLIYLIYGIKILRLKNWARVGAIRLFSLVTLASVIYAGVMWLFLMGEWAFFLLLGLLPNILISLFFLIYFTRPKVREQFR